jgi:asparagine synthase (glutamine-hydrolysing)
MQLGGRHRRDARVAKDVGAIGAATVDEPGCATEGDLLAHDAHATLAFDGNLDDRASLANALDVDVQCADASDARLALAAYRRWGVDGLARLAGDFAIIIWDSRERLLIASRDLFAQRPLYYRIHAGAVWITSEIQALVRAAPAHVNEGMVAELLARRISSVTETLYQDIFRVMPGHAVLFRASGSTTVAVQKIEWHDQGRYATPAEAREDLRAVLTRAVADRLRGPRPVGVLLSGGLDSSALLACTPPPRAPWPQASVGAYTLGFAGATFDESPYAAKVARHVGVRSITVDSALATYDFFGEAADTLQPPTLPSAAAIAGVRRTAAADGVRVMLSGVGSDEWFGGSYWHYADLVRKGNAAAVVRRWRGDRGIPGYVGLPAVLRVLAWESLPPGTQRRVRRVLQRRVHPRWVTEHFANRVGLNERPRWKAPVSADTLANLDVLSGALAPASIAAYEEQSRFAARFGLQDRQPFFDRRIIRCALDIPEEWRTEPARPKAILRDALAPLLPRDVLERTWYHNYSHLITDGLTRLDAGGLFTDSRLAARGWIDAPVLARCVRHACAENHGNRTVSAVQLWPVAALELWYRAAERYLTN